VAGAGGGHGHLIASRRIIRQVHRESLHGAVVHVVLPSPCDCSFDVCRHAVLVRERNRLNFQCSQARERQVYDAQKTCLTVRRNVVVVHPVGYHRKVLSISVGPKIACFSEGQLVRAERHIPVWSRGVVHLTTSQENLKNGRGVLLSGQKPHTEMEILRRVSRWYPGHSAIQLVRCRIKVCERHAADNSGRFCRGAARGACHAARCYLKTRGGSYRRRSGTSRRSRGCRARRRSKRMSRCM